jgi:hypothetical protein
MRHRGNAEPGVAVPLTPISQSEEQDPGYRFRLRSLSYGGQVAHPGYACCSHTRRFQPSGFQPRLFGAIEKGDDYDSSAVLKPPRDHLG